MMTDPIKDARVEEAMRQFHASPINSWEELARIALDLADWTPPNPDLLAAQKWCAERFPLLAEGYLAGNRDTALAIEGFLAGAKHAREQTR